MDEKSKNIFIELKKKTPKNYVTKKEASTTTTANRQHHQTAD